MSDFVHLHCHTEYSLLDGAIRIKELCARAKDFGLGAAAITDHGNLYGAIHFYKTAKSFGLKPIIGCEVYVARASRLDRDARSASQAGYHLVLLAQNETGYRNLIRLVSQGHLEGFHYKPRVDRELLAECSEGLIALSACLKGEVPYRLMREGFDVGLETARFYADLFPGRFYLEMQANGLADQLALNERLRELAEATRLPLVATNDCHYLSADDVNAHDILLCIQTNACETDEKRMRFDTRELYYRSPEEMEAAFADCPQALAATAEIAAACNLELTFNKPHFPAYSLPPGMTLEEELRRAAHTGLEERLAKIKPGASRQVYDERLALELDVICSKGFAGYFLIVQDFINWAKSRNIPVGPGRGSAAGSLVAYALRITDLDPIPYNLLFERFLNAERVSLPDIDVDFCFTRREEVLRYVSEKYGQSNVAQIITFGRMKARAAVRDVGRALGLKPSETDKIAKMVPGALGMTIAKALEQEPDLRKLAEEDPTVGRLIDTSLRLEGLARHASTHAAGVVLSDRPMVEHVPLCLGKKKETVTQWDMKCVESVGLIKFDFLGLKTLTVIQDAVDLVREGGKPAPDMAHLPLDDQQTFDLLCEGRTEGVFQLESSGMRRVLTDLKPSCFEDVIALLALYRPGPLESGMVATFIRCKHGQTPVEYLLPELETILKETYGVILYQEQVMKIASDLAAYSLGEADILRRAMGKKDPQVMAQQRSRFMQGVKTNKLPEAKAAQIFDLMEKFAGYGFNKSHSAAYALISYQTAYLKAHFPVEFMAALISSEVDNADKILRYLNDCGDMDISILPPDVNHSQARFSVQEDKIRFGLSGVKNVGEEAIREVIQGRIQGPYRSVSDLCQRVNTRKVTKRVLEYLIKSGAFDSIHPSRGRLLAGLDTAMAAAQKKAKEKKRSQMSLFACMSGGENGSGMVPDCGLDLGPDDPGLEWTDEEKSRYEKEALGFFLTSNPLRPFREEAVRLGLRTIVDCQDLPKKSEIRLAVLVTGVKEFMTRRGDKMAFCQIEDLTGMAEATAFGDVYAPAKELFHGDRPLLMEARISDYEGRMDNGSENTVQQLKLEVVQVSPLSEACARSDQPVHLRIERDDLSREDVSALKSLFQKHPGQTPVRVVLDLPECRCTLQLGPQHQVLPCPQFWKDVAAWHGEGQSTAGGEA
ncbi:DNA polymerase III, alpha subunit [Desulfonatronum thiosulfatophilum]|uniref:DNA polymerase III subunit alpha n=1 Tax=Desulfonatronum thiosulfatophilum TaxID=617002 RepID=A0A1G6C9E9_9BACT|nr:DNA polymerase III subunit alpha [Desulfonatronum thiosulfatophilum]SDB29442.1 DNA polymerase III, alpha subunit [Desulfonatronum thiosulfatophilum]